MMRFISAGVLAALLGSAAAVAAEAEPAPALRVAKLDAAGHLQRPDDLDRWVFVGAGLGMNYDDSAFSVEHPGPFQIVLMEPSAYEYFKAHGRYADGTMFLLSFYSTDHAASIDRRGYTPGSLAAFEIHLIDHARYPEGRAFFNFGKDARQSTAAPPGNACVQCHVPKGAFDGTFSQFYPPLRAK
jgi:hypothetical protein